MANFNQELDEISAKLKSNNEKEFNKTPSLPNNVKPEIQPNDTVMFNGKKATVVSSWENGDIIIMQDGMTIECTKKQVSLVGKIDTMEVPMKFKNGIPVYENKQSFVRCNLIGNSSVNNIINETYFVDYNSWMRKKGKQKMKIFNEDFHESFDIPKSDITVCELPEDEDGYVNGVIVDSEGGPERKVLINASEYATCTDDSEEISVLFITGHGYRNGHVVKSMLKTLSV